MRCSKKVLINASASNSEDSVTGALNGLIADNAELCNLISAIADCAEYFADEASEFGLDLTH